jgi:DNA-binding response OmpR family regulator
MEKKQEATGPKILLIDDDKTILEVWPKILESYGFNVITAEDGMAGFKKVEQEFPDLVICDVLIPKLDGIKFCETVRASDSFINLPIILASGVFKDFEFRMNVIKSVADDFIQKPFNEEELLDKIKRTLIR